MNRREFIEVSAGAVTVSAVDAAGGADGTDEAAEDWDSDLFASREEAVCLTAYTHASKAGRLLSTPPFDPDEAKRELQAALDTLDRELPDE